MSESAAAASTAPLTIDESTDFGARAARHLREDPVVWLITVSKSGLPAPNPVWFIWDGARTIHIFSMSTAARLKHLAGNSRVALNFAGDGHGGDIVVLSGEAVIDESAPQADADPAYVAKYSPFMAQMNMTPASFAAAYPSRITITLTKLRGH